MQPILGALVMGTRENSLAGLLFFDASTVCAAENGNAVDFKNSILLQLHPPILRQRMPASHEVTPGAPPVGPGPRPEAIQILLDSTPTGRTLLCLAVGSGRVAVDAQIAPVRASELSGLAGVAFDVNGSCQGALGLEEALQSVGGGRWSCLCYRECCWSVGR